MIQDIKKEIIEVFQWGGPILSISSPSFVIIFIFLHKSPAKFLEMPNLCFELPIKKVIHALCKDYSSTIFYAF